MIIVWKIIIHLTNDLIKYVCFKEEQVFSVNITGKDIVSRVCFKCLQINSDFF